MFTCPQYSNLQGGMTIVLIIMVLSANLILSTERSHLQMDCKKL